MAIDGQVCFPRTPFVIPVRPSSCTTGSLGPANDTNKDGVVPDCCQLMSSLILYIESVSVTYCRHSTAVCFLMEGITRFWLPSCLHQSPHAPPIHPSHIICHQLYITVNVKKVAQNPAVLANWHKYLHIKH